MLICRVRYSINTTNVLTLHNVQCIRVFLTPAKTVQSHKSSASEIQVVGLATKSRASKQAAVNTWNRQLMTPDTDAGRQKLHTQAHSSQRDTGIMELGAEEWMGGWLGFIGILSMQVAAISCSC